MTPGPLLSISCITYNHEPFLRECFEGFLIQKTNFSFEILVHDDASSDGTRKIIEDYTAKYPDLFFPIYQKHNQYAKGMRGIMALFNFPRARGKYIALCEGDDFWTDPYKLQKQVDFLENNNDYGLVYTNYIKLNSNNFELIKSKRFSGNVFDKLIISNFIGTLTVCFRKDLLDKVIGLKINDQNFKMGDYPLWLAFASVTKFKYFTDSTSVYRVSPNTMSNQRNIIDRFNFEHSVYDVRFFFIEKYSVKHSCKIKVDKLYILFLISNKVKFAAIKNNNYIKKGLRLYIYYLVIQFIYLIFKNKSSKIILKISI